MKKLFTLMIVWLMATGYLGFEYLKAKKFEDENLGWRKFLVYSYTYMGCNSGILFMLQRGSQNPQDSHEFCRELSYKTEGIYNNAWKEKK